jgi:hypothetical protein
MPPKNDTVCITWSGTEETHAPARSTKPLVSWKWAINFVVILCGLGCISCTTVYIQKCDLDALFPETPLVIVDTLSSNRLTLGASLGINTENLTSKDTSDYSWFKKIDTTNHDPDTYYQGLNYLDSIDTSRNNVLWHLPQSTASVSASMDLWNVVSFLAHLQLGYLNAFHYDGGIGVSLHYCFGPVSFQVNDMAGAYNSNFHAKYFTYASSYDIGVRYVEFVEHEEKGRNSNIFNQVNFSVNSNNLPYVNFMLNFGDLWLRYLSVYNNEATYTRSFIKISPSAYTTLKPYRLILTTDLIIDEMNFDLPPFLRAGITLQRVLF